MYAVIRTGGKQYRVAKDDVIFVEKLAGEPGASVNPSCGVSVASRELSSASRFDEIQIGTGPTF